MKSAQTGMKRPPSLAQALSRTLLPWVAILWIATSLAVGWYMQHELEEQIDASLMESAERLLDLAVHDDSLQTDLPARLGLRTPQAVTRQQTEDEAHDVLLYQVVDAQGSVLLRSTDAPAQALPVPLRTGYHTTPLFRLYTLAHPTLPLFIHVGEPLAHRRDSLRETLIGLILPLFVVLPFLAWLIQTLLRRALHSAGMLAEELQRRDGQHLQALPPQQDLPLELQSIADSANHLLRRLADALDIERALAANAAHELRTPLAALRLHLQSAQARLSPADLASPASLAGPELQQALSALDRLQRRTEKLLQLSRAESGAGLAQDRVNLGQLAGLVAQEFWADPAVLQRLQLVVPEDVDVWARGDVDALAMALRNLVENAIRYAPSGAIVLEVGLPACCSVRDQGPGMSASQLALLPQRHQRGTATDPASPRKHPVPGYGLGLSIVRTIVERQGGTLQLVSPPPGQDHGLQATLLLRPAVEDPQR